MSYVVVVPFFHFENGYFYLVGGKLVGDDGVVEEGENVELFALHLNVLLNLCWLLK